MKLYSIYLITFFMYLLLFVKGRQQNFLFKDWPSIILLYNLRKVGAEEAIVAQVDDGAAVGHQWRHDECRVA